MRFLLPLSLLLLLFLSCKHATVPNEKELIIKSNDFKSVKPDSIIETPITGFFSGIFIVDTVLFCATYRDSMNLYMFSTNSFKPLGHFLKRGDKTGECVGIANLIRTNNPNIFWVYDITLGKLLKYNLREVLANNNSSHLSEILLTDSSKNMRSLNLVNDSVFVGSSYIIKNSRGVHFSTASSTIIKKFGALPEPREEWPMDHPSGKLDLLATVYSSRVLYNDNLNTTVFAYMFSDRIDIYQNDTLSKVLKGPENFDVEPNFEIHKDYIHVKESEKSRYAYNDLFGNDNYIFAFFKGKNVSSLCGTTLLSFDWKGNPIKSITLPNGFCSFAINSSISTENLIWAYNFEKRRIFKLTIK